MVKGSPAWELVSRSKSADLVVLGSSSIDAFTAEPVVKRVSEMAASDVLIVRRQPRLPYRRIVVTADFSESSRTAVVKSMELFPDADITVLYSLPSRFDPVMADAGAETSGLSSPTVHPQRRSMRWFAARTQTWSWSRIGALPQPGWSCWEPWPKVWSGGRHVTSSSPGRLQLSGVREHPSSRRRRVLASEVIDPGRDNSSWGGAPYRAGQRSARLFEWSRRPARPEMGTRPRGGVGPSPMAMCAVTASRAWPDRRLAKRSRVDLAAASRTEAARALADRFSANIGSRSIRWRRPA